MAHLFTGGTVQMLAKDLLEYKVVQLNFNFSISEERIEEIGQLAYKEFPMSFVEKVYAYRIPTNKDDRTVSSVIYTLGEAPFTTNKQAKQLLDPSF